MSTPKPDLDISTTNYSSSVTKECVVQLVKLPCTVVQLPESITKTRPVVQAVQRPTPTPEVPTQAASLNAHNCITESQNPPSDILCDEKNITLVNTTVTETNPSHSAAVNNISLPPQQNSPKVSAELIFPIVAQLREGLYEICCAFRLLANDNLAHACSSQICSAAVISKVIKTVSSNNNFKLQHVELRLLCELVQAVSPELQPNVAKLTSDVSMQIHSTLSSLKLEFSETPCTTTEPQEIALEFHESTVLSFSTLKFIFSGT